MIIDHDLLKKRKNEYYLFNLIFMCYIYIIIIINKNLFKSINTFIFKTDKVTVKNGKNYNLMIKIRLSLMNTYSYYTCVNIQLHCRV
jgi:hypothetical protein